MPERERKPLLDVEGAARLLHVPKSWLYGKTRLRGAERLPHTRLGRYIRFSEDDIDEIVRRFNRAD